jgi:endonuclease/exonuclease/phosphatase family metal-dependent hydrolase
VPPRPRTTHGGPTLTTSRLPRLVTAPLALGLAVVALASLVLVPGVALPAGAEQPREVTVMTRNLYLGANLDPAIGARNVDELLAATAHIFSVAHRTDFPERAKALAREVADADPALVGLQEAAVWYTGPLNDPAPATTVEYDFVATLLHELAALGARYELVRAQPEADIEAPAGAPYFSDVRLLQQDAVLVRTGPGHKVALSDPWSANFSAELTITAGTGLQFAVHRGWVAVDVTVKNQSFRFVNTHLEAFHPLIRLQQAQELLAPDGPVGSAPGPVVLVGDLNSGPDLPVPANRLAFQALLAAGLVDTWAVAHPGDPGFTAGYSELLTDPAGAGALEHRVDHVLVTSDIGVVGSRLYGTDPAARTASGMWPSDHAGVAATLALPPRR